MQRGERTSAVNEKAIENAVASVEMEGFTVKTECILWCEQLLNGEMSMSDYIELVKQAEGV